MSRRSTVALMATTALLVGAATAPAAKKLITGKQIKNSSITGADIKNRSVSAADLSAGVAGSLVAFTTVESAARTIPNDGNVYSVEVGCPAGTTVVGTGFFNSIATVGFVRSYGSFVRMAIINDTTIPVSGVTVQAICASVQSASLRSRSATDRSRADHDLAELRATVGRR